MAESSTSVMLQDDTELQKVFRRFDSDGDGKISSSELRDVLCSLGSHVSPDELRDMMAEMDADGDGFVNFKEFADFHRDNGSHDGGISELREAFDLYDLDKNGLISSSELHKVLKRLGEKCSVHDCARMIKSVDSDGDGNVNFEEFKKMMTKKTIH